MGKGIRILTAQFFLTTKTSRFRRYTAWESNLSTEVRERKVLQLSMYGDC